MPDADSDRLLIAGGRVVDPSQGLDEVADVLIRNGLIEAIGAFNDAAAPADCPVVDARGLIVSPGFVDLHAHLREPGFEHKETIATGTRAAARGGFTTVCAMPNTDPVQDNGATIEYVMRRARETAVARVLPIGAVTVGRKGARLADMAEMAAAGAVGFSDDGDPVADANLMRQALSYASGLGLPVINHCQEPSLTAGAQMNEGPVADRLGLRGWPAEAEAAMVARDAALAGLTGGRVHIAHISTAQAVRHVRAAKERGLSVTAEVMPHHLTMTDEWVLGTHGETRAGDALSLAAYDTSAKVNPPLRGSDDVEAVAEALRDGVIDFLATDHAPHAETDKRCTFAEAAFGISCLETALGSALSLVHRGMLPLPTLIERMTSGPARFLGKDLGSLKPGFPADVAIFDPDAEWIVDPDAFASKGKNTPLAGVTLRGRVVTTVFGGKIVFQHNRGAGGGRDAVAR